MFYKPQPKSPLCVPSVTQGGGLLASLDAWSHASERRLGCRNELKDNQDFCTRSPKGWWVFHFHWPQVKGAIHEQAQTSLRQNLRDLPRGAWILFFGTFLNKFGTFVMPFLAIYMTSMGYSPAQAGSAIAAYGTGSLLACFLGGVLADRLGRRKTIVLSMFLAGIAMLCLSQARGLTAIFICTFFAGLTGRVVSSGKQCITGGPGPKRNAGDSLCGLSNGV